MLYFWHIYCRETGLEECVKGFHLASFVMKLYFELSSELRFFWAPGIPYMFLKPNEGINKNYQDISATNSAFSILE